MMNVSRYSAATVFYHDHGSEDRQIKAMVGGRGEKLPALVLTEPTRVLRESAGIYIQDSCGLCTGIRFL